jgi:predicted permease
VAQVSASVVLLFGCGLLLRALWSVEGVDPGFRAEGVVTLRTALPLPKYGATADRARFYSRVLADVRALPGVHSAAYISGLPMVMRGGVWDALVPGEASAPGARPKAAVRYVTPGFFDTLGIPLRAGRDIRDADTVEARPYAAVVSESFARRHWPGQQAIGRRFEIALAEREVVGIVADVRVRGLEQTSEPQVYLSHQQVPDNSIIGYTPKDLAVRTDGQGLDVLPALRAIVHGADPEQPISHPRLLSDIVSGETAPRRVQVRVLGGFAAVAFLLAAIGIHGLLSFAVASRTHEIGVRMALGARPGHILSMVLNDGMKMAAAGVALGLFLSYAAGRGMESLLVGVRPHDPATLAAATALAVVMTLLGTLVPARRAVRVSALEVLHPE